MVRGWDDTGAMSPGRPNDDAFPMFPLGSVLLPSMVLPLHVFEDRYRQLVDDVLEADEPEFGVALIERGSEVGGGDFRSMSGCVARIIEAGRTDDGRWALVTVGTRRIRVRQWLEDRPYPRALVEDWPDEPDGPGDATDDVTVDATVDATSDGRTSGIDEATLTVTESDLRRVSALGSELGMAGLPPELEFSEDPTLRVYQFGVLAPLGSLDRLRLLEAATVSRRLGLLRTMLAEQEELLRAQLAFGGGPGQEGDPDSPWS